MTDQLDPILTHRADPEYPVTVAYATPRRRDDVYVDLCAHCQGRHHYRIPYIEQAGCAWLVDRRCPTTRRVIVLDLRTTTPDANRRPGVSEGSKT